MRAHKVALIPNYSLTFEDYLRSQFAPNKHRDADDNANYCGFCMCVNSVFSRITWTRHIAHDKCAGEHTMWAHVLCLPPQKCARPSDSSPAEKRICMPPVLLSGSSLKTVWRQKYAERFGGLGVGRGGRVRRARVGHVGRGHTGTTTR